MKHVTICSVVVAIAFLATGPALVGGLITTHSDRPTFNGSVSGPLTVEDFTETTHNPILTGILNSSTNLPGIGLSPGDIEAGVTYSTPVGTGFFFNIDGGGGYPTPFLDGFSPSTRDLTVTFDLNAEAFGFDTRQIVKETDFDISIQLASGPDFNGNFAIPVLPGGSLQFFGFQGSAADIQSAVISFNNGSFGFSLDNFTFNVVPEPSSIVLFGLGTVGLVFMERRRRKRKMAA